MTPLTPPPIHAEDVSFEETPTRLVFRLRRVGSRAQYAWTGLLLLLIVVPLLWSFQEWRNDKGEMVTDLLRSGVWTLLLLLPWYFSVTGRRAPFLLDKADGYYRPHGGTDRIARLDAIQTVLARPVVGPRGGTFYEVVLVNPAGRLEHAFLHVGPTEMHTWATLEDAYAVAKRVAAFLGAEAVKERETKGKKI